MIVVPKDDHPLLGRDLMRKCGLGISPLDNNVNSIDVEGVELQKLHNDYKEVFSEKLGLYKYEKIELKVVENAKPVYFKPRSIPFAFRNKVDEELDRLEKEGIIKRVENSDWAHR